MIKEYIEHLKKLNYDQSMIDHLCGSIAKWSDFLKETSEGDVLKATAKELEAYVAALKKEGGSAAVSFVVTTLSKFYTFLKKEGHIFYSPFDLTKVDFRIRRLPRDVPGHQAIMKVLNHPNPKDLDGFRNKAILELVYSSALTNKEICNVSLGDLDLEKAVVFVKGDGRGRPDRLIPIGERACKAIGDYLRESRPKFVRNNPREDRVFVSILGQPVSQALVRYCVLRHRKASPETAKLTAHGLRHACATEMLKRGSDVQAVRQIMGHARLSTTREIAKYTPAAPSKKSYFKGAAHV